MRVNIQSGFASSNNQLKKIFSFDKNNISLFANVDESDFDFELTDGSRIYIFGDIFYFLENMNVAINITRDNVKYLENIFNKFKTREIIERLEGQYIVLHVEHQTKKVKIYCDRYTKSDLFYSFHDNNFFLATDLDFIFKNIKPKYDQKMLAHMFSVYGWYTPKGHTIYSNVKQIKVGEILTISDDGISSEFIVFKPLEIQDYQADSLDTYYDILKKSIASRIGDDNVWLLSSSGWDSSIILGLIVNEFGKERINTITGSVKYSDETKIINKFEIDKIKKISQFYGLKPLIVDLDFKSKSASDFWKTVLPYYKSKHMYSFGTYNFAKVSSALLNIDGKNKIVLNGHMSDSYHNFGFSQFATFFHTSKPFTEYADKMNCYLYGPSFLKKIINGTHQKDKVFQIFTRMIDQIDFSSSWDSKKEMIKSYLFPFLYGSQRVPFEETNKNKILNNSGQISVFDFLIDEYMPEIVHSISEKNIYSWLIYLYHSFHSQGSTVGCHRHAMEHNGHKLFSPFNDVRLINFLSMAPESWGRGLDLNHTKYPLKWVAKNKIRFPYELLEQGPHSYLYDVIEGFSLLAEITYRSGVTELFKETLKSKPYKNILDEKYFDLNYINNLCDDFLNGKEVGGKDFNNLISLITLSTIGWY